MDTQLGGRVLFEATISMIPRQENAMAVGNFQPSLFPNLSYSPITPIRGRMRTRTRKWAAF